MRPINKYIIVKQIKEELKTSSGLLLSADDASQFRYKKAVIIKKGDNVNNMSPEDIIYYDKAAGHEILLQDEAHTIILERDVVVVL
tara:strand:+ start:2057 stop:2314 length:258 start_codon:yes stop_codon:yes gene_type:complete